MTEPRVFIPKIVEKRNPLTREFESVFDLSSVDQFGKLTPILDRRDDPKFMARMMPTIRSTLESFDPEKDYFLAIGDPSFIAVCSGLLFQRRAKFRMLKWDRKTSQYVVMELNP
jgi:hypothetical protein